MDFTDTLRTVAKAIAGGVVAWLVTELHHRLDWHVPAEMQTALIGIVVAGVVWVVPNKLTVQQVKDAKVELAQDAKEAKAEAKKS